MDNLVIFPRNTLDFPTTKEQSQEKLQEVRREFSDEVASDAFESVMAVLNSYGIGIKTDDNFIKDLVFLEETIKSYIYRHKKLEHPFHEMIENVITVPGDSVQESHEKSEKDLEEKLLNK